MKFLAKFALVFTVLAVFAVPFASANHINTGGRCIHEAKIYQHDPAGSEGLGVITFDAGGNPFQEFIITLDEIVAVLGEDENGNVTAPDGLLKAEGDVFYFHSNNGTPADLTDDFVTISVLTAFDPATVACLFVFNFADFGSLSPGDLTVYQQYPDGTPIELWHNTGNGGPN
mgnify:CR=1 FL=1